MATIIKGDLLNCDAQIIVHQTNCVTRKPHGLSKDIAKRWPIANVYGKRLGDTPNTAFEHHQGVAGTCKLMPTGCTKPRFVACLMGQVCPGSKEKARYWNQFYNKDYTNDTAVARLHHFRNGLLDLETKLPSTLLMKEPTIAFPYMIGCGLAGGKWEDYRPLIDDFADRVNTKGWCVKVYENK